MLINHRLKHSCKSISFCPVSDEILFGNREHLDVMQTMMIACTGCRSRRERKVLVLWSIGGNIRPQRYSKGSVHSLIFQADDENTWTRCFPGSSGSSWHSFSNVWLIVTIFIALPILKKGSLPAGKLPYT